MRRYRIILGVSLLAAAGFSPNIPDGVLASHQSAVPVQLASALIFSPAPSSYSASNFAYRSDWPSVRSYYPGGQVIYYSEHFYDYQGPNVNPNWTYRLFETHRSGYGYR